MQKIQFNLYELFCVQMTNDDIYGHGEISAHRTFNEGDNLYEK